MLYEQIRRYAARLLGNAGANAGVGEDIAQEVFLRLEQQRSTIQQLQPWAYRTARNLVIDRFRRDGKIQSADGLPDNLPADATRFNPAILAEKKEILEMIERKMNELSPRHREVLRLKFQEGLKYAQIAEVLGEPVTTIAWLIHEALDKLRKELNVSH
ncbi:MAG: RNA polymerase sigma factor [Planctomycetaceae bacterium]|jgi:RNA polymerase sigma-70 factor (ECF subfamily)|nr:RNA polymerase sigma factor [Planctomycetaceae bacterium]